MWNVTRVAQDISLTRINGNQIKLLMQAVLDDLDPLPLQERTARYKRYEILYYARHHPVWNTILNTVCFYYDSSGNQNGDRDVDRGFDAVVQALQTGETIKAKRVVTINVDRDY